MSLKLKKIILVQFCFLNLIYFIPAFSHDFSPSDALNRPSSSLAASSGAGASAPGDASMMDANPAILPALKRQYTLSTGMAWSSKIDSFEVSAFDSTLPPLAMAIRVRETIPNGTSRDRSIKVGLGYKLPNVSNLSLGLSFDYQQINLTELWKWNENNYRVGLGAFYQINLNSDSPIFLGLSTNGLFDKYNAKTFDFGVSTFLLDQSVNLSSDVLFDTKNGLQSFVGGLTFITKVFLEVKGSVGYNPKFSRFFWGSGIFLKSPVLHVYYTLVKNDSNDTTLKQTAGIEFALSL